MGDVYRFRSGDPIDDKALRRAMDLTVSARDAMVMAKAFEGHDDQRRDDFLDTAAASLSAAQKALVEAMTPPPVPPAVSKRADVFLRVAADIAGVLAPEKAAS